MFKLHIILQGLYNAKGHSQKSCKCLLKFVIPALERQRHTDLWSWGQLVYRLSSRSVRAMQWDPITQNKNTSMKDIVLTKMFSIKQNLDMNSIGKTMWGWAWSSLSVYSPSKYKTLDLIPSTGRVGRNQTLTEENWSISSIYLNYSNPTRGASTKLF